MLVCVSVMSGENEIVGKYGRSGYFVNGSALGRSPTVLSGRLEWQMWLSGNDDGDGDSFWTARTVYQRVKDFRYGWRN